MKRIFFILAAFSIITVLIYSSCPRVKFYTYFGICLPSFCSDINFTEKPDFMAILGMDGQGASASFNIQRADIEKFITDIKPQSLWLKYSESDSSLKDLTLHYPVEIPKQVLKGQINVMLWSNDTKGDYFNIWLIPDENGIIRVTISMPFT